VFGPVASRRLGRSLGIDVVPYKTCTFDCVYCQLGRTTRQTIERRAWFTLDEILADVRSGLDARPDYVTIGGSGEPTLYADIGALIASLKSLTTTPVAVLTNGSLLWRTDVREALQQADVVIPSLDAADEVAFQVVNRPHEALSAEQVWQGLVEFQRSHRGAYWLEVFLIDGPSSAEPRVSQLVERVSQLGADCVQLNTVTRPPAESWVAPVPPARLAEIAQAFAPPAEVIAARPTHPFSLPGQVTREMVLGLLQRRPCTLADIATGLAVHRHEVIKILDELVADGHVHAEVVSEQTCFTSHRRPQTEGETHAVSRYESRGN
jgi:wyosine [tRNA(Phe)-imidazoG37] synthetase (radical SAM superfamily)